MSDQRVKGQWPFLSMKGSPLRTDLSASLGRLNLLKKYPIYLLEISNQKIGIILDRVIDSLPPRNRNTLSSVFQLQQVEIVLQNALHSQKGEITTRLRESMRTRIFDYNYFLEFMLEVTLVCNIFGFHTEARCSHPLHIGVDHLVQPIAGNVITLGNSNNIPSHGAQEQQGQPEHPDRQH